MKIKIIVTGLLLFLSSLVFPQSEIKKQFRELTKGKQSLDEIVEVYQEYVNTLADSYEKAKFEKHFARWAYYGLE